MSPAAISRNFKKALKLLQGEGLVALFKIIYFRILVALNARWGSVLQRSNPKNSLHTQVSGRRIVLFTGVPYDDVGGGQRSAQLTRAALRTGIQVLYVYAYPKYDFAKRRNVVSSVRLPNLFHKSIRELSEQEFTRFIHDQTTVIFEIPHPLFVKYLEIARSSGVRTTFELIDDWTTSLGGDWFNLDVFQHFVTNSSLVVGTARVLVDKLVEMGRSDAVYLPNAANEYIFNYLNTYERPTDLPAGSYALYFGSLYGEWFGWEYINTPALKNPSLNFCLIGSQPPEMPISLPPNVYFLGEKKIEDLPAYLSHAKFCLLPFRPGKLSDAVSPIKLFEYLFMLKPVVASNIAEVVNYPNVFTARDEHEFGKLCEKLDQGKMIAGAGKLDLQEFIAQNSWFSRLQNIIGSGGQANTSAIILIHNNREIIGRCLSSLLKNCASYLAEVIVVDNASQDGGADFVLENFPQVHLVRNPVNGCSSGRNLGVKEASGKYLAFFDSDQWFTGGFCFEEALHILEFQPDIGAVGWAAGWLELIESGMQGSIVDFYPYRAMHTRASLRGYRTDIAYLGSGGLFMPRTVFDSAGGFDPAYDPTSFEDTDLSFAIKRQGFKIAYRDLTCIRHEEHQTTTASDNSPAYQELYSRNSTYLLNKWTDYRQFFKKYAL